MIQSTAGWAWPGTSAACAVHVGCICPLLPLRASEPDSDRVVPMESQAPRLSDSLAVKYRVLCCVQVHLVNNLDAMLATEFDAGAPC